jgi:hypothetical protein
MFTLFILFNVTITHTKIWATMEAQVTDISFDSQELSERSDGIQLGQESLDISLPLSVRSKKKKSMSIGMHYFA